MWRIHWNTGDITTTETEPTDAIKARATIEMLPNRASLVCPRCLAGRVSARLFDAHGTMNICPDCWVDVHQVPQET
jgi:hypothetical protein